MKKFFVSDISDNRMIYAINALKKSGYEWVNKYENADFAISPPKSELLEKSVDYLKNENFELNNAYLTAESALAIAISESKSSLVNSKILVIGYGRIAKALHRYLSVFTGDITVCARNPQQRILARNNNARAINFSELRTKKDYDFVFNTVPFPVVNRAELKSMKKDVLIVDLASFPGGVDKHEAEAMGLKLVQSWGLPGKYSPKTAGCYLAEAVDEIVREKIE